MDIQDKWAFCSKCATLFWNGHVNKGQCAAGGGHNGDITLPYFVAHSGAAGPDQVNGFRFCEKCHILYLQKDLDPFHSDGSTLGVCPAGGGHGTEHSFAYVLDRDHGDQAHGEHKWFACLACNGVVHGPEGDRACPGHSEFVIGHSPGDLNDPPLLRVHFFGD